MKGFGTVVLSLMVSIIGLAVIVAIMNFAMTGPKANEREIIIKEEVYKMRDAVELAKVYLKDAARHSLIQAAYNNGKIGTLRNPSENEIIEFGGKTYALWFNSTDLSPEYSYMVYDDVELATRANLLQYTKDGSVKTIYPVSIPDLKNLEIKDLGSDFIELTASSAEKIHLNQTLDSGDIVMIEKPSDISLVEHLTYFRLYQEAKKFHEEIMKVISTVDPSIIEQSHDNGWYTTESTVEYLGDDFVLGFGDDTIIVKVSVKTKEEFLVWDSDENKIAYKPLEIVFLEKHIKSVKVCRDNERILLECKQICERNEIMLKPQYVLHSMCAEELERLALEGIEGHEPEFINEYTLYFKPLNG